MWHLWQALVIHIHYITVYIVLPYMFTCDVTHKCSYCLVCWLVFTLAFLFYDLAWQDMFVSVVSKHVQSRLTVSVGS